MKFIFKNNWAKYKSDILFIKKTIFIKSIFLSVTTKSKHIWPSNFFILLLAKDLSLYKEKVVFFFFCLAIYKKLRERRCWREYNDRQTNEHIALLFLFRFRSVSQADKLGNTFLLYGIHLKKRRQREIVRRKKWWKKKSLLYMDYK